MPAKPITTRILRSLLGLLVVFAAELFYRKKLSEESGEQAENMQKITKLKSFFETIAMLGSFEAQVFYLVIAFNTMAKPASLYLWSSMAFMTYLANELQALYSQQRPYWLHEEIKSERCILNYGNPSNSLMTMTFLIVSAYLHKYYEIGVKPKKMNVFCTAYIVKMAASAATLCFLIFLTFSRVYLGASSLNQTLFGVSLGALLAFIGHFCIKAYFLDMPEYYYTNIGGSAFRVKCCSYLSAFLLCLILPTGLAYGVFALKFYVMN